MAATVKTIPLLSERAYERVKHDIICCLFAPGSEISEAQLCAQYKLGKAPVRMALSRLAHDGLVRAIPRRGYMVTPVTLKDIQDVFELRLLLEPPAARLAASPVFEAGVRAVLIDKAPPVWPPAAAAPDDAVLDALLAPLSDGGLDGAYYLCGEEDERRAAGR
jgi:hypothetical protein